MIAGVPSKYHTYIYPQTYDQHKINMIRVELQVLMMRLHYDSPK